MLYPTCIKIEDNIIKTINLASTQNKETTIFIMTNCFDITCFGNLTFAEQAQLKSLIKYLFS